MDPELAKLLALDPEDEPQLILPKTDAQLFLQMPSALIDSVISYLDSTDIKASFNACKQLRSHLQKPKYWADFKVRITGGAEQRVNKGKKYFICFIRKCIDIWDAAVINSPIWNELIVYFGIWEISANLTQETAFGPREIASPKDSGSNSKSLKEKPISSLRKFIERRTSNNDNSSTDNQSTLVLDSNMDSPAPAENVKCDAILSDLLAAAVSNILAIRFDGTVIENNPIFRELKCPHVQFIEFSQRCVYTEPTREQYNALYGDGNTVSMAELYPRLRILSVESIEHFWRTLWLQHTLHTFDSNLVMLRIFDSKWDRRTALTLPHNLEFFRFTARDESIAGIESNDTRGLNESEIMDYSLSTKGYLNSIDFIHCNKLTEIVLDFQTLSCLYPLFRTKEDLLTNGDECKTRDMSDKAVPIQYLPDLSQEVLPTKKTQAELSEILPSLKRIVIVDYQLKQQELMDFLILTGRWLRSKQILIYFPKIDEKNLNRLILGIDGDETKEDRENIISDIDDDDDDDDDENDDNDGSGMDSDSSVDNAGGTGDGGNDEMKLMDTDIDINGNRVRKKKVKRNKSKSAGDGMFLWKRWKKQLKAARLSVYRWKDSPDYLLFLRATAWKLWWLKDLQLRHEPYYNLVY